MVTEKLFLLLCSIVVSCSWAYASRDPAYSVELLSSQPAKDFDNTWVYWDTLAMKKISRNNYGLSGDIVLNRNLGNQQKLTITAFKYDSERKLRGPIVFEYKRPFCEFVQKDEDTYPGMMEKSNLPQDKPCPFPKDTYTFEGYELKTTFLPNSTPKGDYLVVMNLKDNELNVAGYEVEITLTDP